jgi:hypothetical protein
MTTFYESSFISNPENLRRSPSYKYLPKHSAHTGSGKFADYKKADRAEKDQD